MATIRNPKFNLNDPNSQEFIFDKPTVINQVTGQLSDTLTGEDLKSSPDLNITIPDAIPTPDVKNIPVTEPPKQPEQPISIANDLTSKLSELQTKLLGKPITKETAVTERTAGFTRSLNELNTQIKLHQARSLERQEEAVKQGETLRFATGLAGQVARTDAIEAMKLSALAQGMQGNILLAEKQAQNAIETEFAKVEQDIQTARQNILNNYDTFTGAEKKRADATLLSLNEKDAFVKQNETDRKQSYDLSIKVAENGLTDIKLLMQIQNADPEEAVKLASPYLVKKEEPIIRDFEVGGRLKRQVIDKMTGKVISETDLGAKEAKPIISDIAEEALTGEFGDIIKSASNLVGAEKSKTSKAAIAEAIANNDFVSAYAQVANNVEESLTGEVKTKFANARIDYGVMQGLRNTIQKFADAGGNMGYLKGTADEIARRFGQLETDPKFAALAVQLTREFQMYRVGMTGAAFSPKESSEYEAVNPRTKASLNLNLATIDGALNQLENRITSTINAKIPNAKKLYEKVGGDGMSDDDAYNEYLKLTGQR